jgi:hypothetical protein
MKNVIKVDFQNKTRKDEFSNGLGLGDYVIIGSIIFLMFGIISYAMAVFHG